MTEQEAKTLPLWEVWKEMDSLIRLSIPHLEKLASPDYRVDEAMRPIYANQLAGCKTDLATLRAVLLERCKRVGIRQNTTRGTRFSIVDGSIHVDNWGATIRHDTPETARNMSAAYAFMAWELEQRQKDGPN